MLYFYKEHSNSWVKNKNITIVMVQLMKIISTEKSIPNL